MVDWIAVVGGESGTGQRQALATTSVSESHRDTRIIRERSLGEIRVVKYGPPY